MSGANAPRQVGAGPQRRVLFGLLDAAGWGWAGVRAVAWTLVIILLLGYIPDRAYYLVVSPTVDLGLNLAPIVNICPAENEGLPCPAPRGALLPWKSASTPSLPGAGTGGALVQAGSRLYYVGGYADVAFDENAVVSDVAAAEIRADGLSAFSAVAPLPEPRARTAAAFFAGKAYIVGGTSVDQHAVTSVFVGAPDATGAITSWAVEPTLELPEPRTGAAIVTVSDGLILIGGDNNANVPQSTVWKAKLDDTGNLGAWAPLSELPASRVDAAAVLVGDAIWVWGGRDESGPTGVALRGDIAVPKSIAGGHSVATPSPEQIAQGDAAVGTIYRWRATEGDANLPSPRSEAALWSANGILYVAGGNTADGTQLTSMLWAAPSAAGGISSWANVPQSDLPTDEWRAGAHGTVIGANALLIGGLSASSTSEPATLVAGTSPKAPVFRLGILGATIPGLAISGEVGQQLGYLSAAGAWTLNFVLLLAAAVVYAQRERAAAWLRRKLGRKGSATY